MAVVKWFNHEKGFGFLRLPGESRDVFVHFSEILQLGHRGLFEGQQVECSIEEGTKGLMARRVVPGDTEGRRVCPSCRHVWCESAHGDLA